MPSHLNSKESIFNLLGFKNALGVSRSLLESLLAHVLLATKYKLTLDPQASLQRSPKYHGGLYARRSDQGSPQLHQETPTSRSLISASPMMAAVQAYPSQVPFESLCHKDSSVEEAYVSTYQRLSHM